MTTGIVYDPIFLEHRTQRGFPECPERLKAVLEHLKNQAWHKDLISINKRKATTDEVLQVHSLNHLRRVEKACLLGDQHIDSPDVSIGSDSYEVALYAAGSVLNVIDAVMKGSVSNGFCLARPPGHHAEEDGAMGFCLFNNIAIAARYIQKTYGIEKILILDWDVHHGNGVQHIFEEDPYIFYISLHQFPCYPGTGSRHETGIGKGKGATLNCPVPAGMGDAEYQDIFKDVIESRVTSFKPEFILISSGFDAHEDDPLANMNLSSSMYSWMTDWVNEYADKFCNKRIVSILEGGYNLSALSVCVAKHLERLMSC